MSEEKTPKEQAEAYLSAIPMWTKKKNSFSDIREFLEELGNPDQKLPVIHVAGTNGKGSVCAFLTSALVSAGYKTGTFISPHLTEVRERFLLNGEMVSEDSFQESFEEVLAVTKRMQAKGKCHPTFFEFLFEMAMVLFAKEKVEYMILETGLGGRLDTTNVIAHPLFTVITSISMDHMQYLGNTIAEIAGEKAGILKKGTPLIFDASGPEAAQVILGKAAEVGVSVTPVYPEDYEVLEQTDEENAKDTASGNTAFTDTVSADTDSGLVLEIHGNRPCRLRIPFAAPYQGANEALAFQVCSLLRNYGLIPPERWELVLSGLEHTCWPGRMEAVGSRIYLDGAHNPDGILKFSEAASRLSRQQREKEKEKGRTLLLFAAVADKDYREMIRILCEHTTFDLAAVTHIDSERGLSEESLQQTLAQASGKPVRGFPDTKAALDWMLSQKKEHELLFCVGSLYLIGEIKRELDRRKV